MAKHRIEKHPIIDFDTAEIVDFTFNGKQLKAVKDEVISTALFAYGYHEFGKHHKDGSPQGIFCANGQCAQCLILADGKPVKGCITKITPGMKVESIEGLPALPEDDDLLDTSEIPEIDTDVLIVGGGPAGLSAAVELGMQGVKTILADDKHELGGKLTLQTHNFFGSTTDCYAGMRGFEIGGLLAKQVEESTSVDVWLNSPVVGVFVDGKIGIVKDGKYQLVNTKRLLVTAGAREKALAFPGCDLPGIYGAGAFQTLVNRDGIKSAKRIFIIGGGNVGLIVAYHALQAGIDVAGLVEAMPSCGGYKVHLDKIKRLGVPVFTSHTVLRAEGKDHLEKVIITKIDEEFKPINGTEKEFEADTLLVAVGLSPINELAVKARKYGIATYTAGDSDEIAEASAAIFTGRITGRMILKDKGFDVDIPQEWDEMSEVLRSKPGPTHEFVTPEAREKDVYPVIRCIQEIPCDPCVESCIKSSIKLSESNILGLPQYIDDCIGCSRCVSACPGLAITLVDRRNVEKGKAKVILPWELEEDLIKVGDTVKTVGFEGASVGTAKVIAIKNSPLKNKRTLLHLEVPSYHAEFIAGIQMREVEAKKMPEKVAPISDEDIIVCRCERVTKKDIVNHIKNGCSDFNSLKAALRVGMGPCGGKTCTELVYRIFREVGVQLGNIEPNTDRPFTQEVPLKAFLEGGEE